MTIIMDPMVMRMRAPTTIHNQYSSIILDALTVSPSGSSGEDDLMVMGISLSSSPPAEVIRINNI